MNLVEMVNDLPEKFTTDELIGVLEAYESSVNNCVEVFGDCDRLYDLRSKFPGIYGDEAKAGYGTGNELEDCECIYPIQYFFDHPDSEVQIYKACPRHCFGIETNSRVTLSRYRAQKECINNQNWHVITMFAKTKFIRYGTAVQDCEYSGLPKTAKELRFDKPSETSKD